MSDKRIPREAPDQTPEAAAPGVQTAASPAVERDPNEIVKTNKSDAVKVRENDPATDPFRGQGGAYVINDEGVRVPAESNK